MTVSDKVIIADPYRRVESSSCILSQSIKYIIRIQVMITAFNYHTKVLLDPAIRYE